MLRRPHPILAINLPPWLYAKTKKVQGLTGLVVYRSVQCCRDDSPQYSPVRSLLADTDHKLLDRREVLDKSGEMFALCELSLYALGVLDVAADLAGELVIALQEECARFVEV